MQAQDRPNAPPPSADSLPYSAAVPSPHHGVSAAAVWHGIPARRVAAHFVASLPNGNRASTRADNASRYNRPFPAAGAASSTALKGEEKEWFSSSKGKQKRDSQMTVSFLVLALPIFPGRLQPSIVGRSELNFRVRDGNGWTLALISTNLLSCVQESKQRKLYHFSLLTAL